MSPLYGLVLGFGDELPTQNKQLDENILIFKNLLGLRSYLLNRIRCILENAEHMNKKGVLLQIKYT